jgi:hypothetical protein
MYKSIHSVAVLKKSHFRLTAQRDSKQVLSKIIILDCFRLRQGYGGQAAALAMP